jgi:hypothetical protein
VAAFSWARFFEIGRGAGSSGGQDLPKGHDMASVRIGRYEAVEGLLPPVCMKCGAEALLFKKKTFSWHPSWVLLLLIAGLLPFLIVPWCLPSA